MRQVYALGKSDFKERESYTVDKIYSARQRTKGEAHRI